MEENWRYELKENDRFSFECSTCGECCRGDMIIRLNLFDLQKMLQFVGGETTGELFENGYVSELPLDNGGFRPYIRFKQALGISFCPFLENRLNDDDSLLGLCQLHPHKKPLVCHLAPFGREIEGEQTRYYFTEPISGCPGCKGGKMNAVSTILSEHSEELKLEKVYFSIMDGMQAEKAGIEEFRLFHQQLRKDEIIGEYLEKWQGR